MPTQEPTLRLAILQRVCGGYRVSLFADLASRPGITLRLLIGEDIPDNKVQGVAEIPGVDFRKLKTRHIKLKRRVLTWHLGLVRELREFDPQVIFCEGESHFLGYLQAIFYRSFFNRRAALMHWCFISLPGRPVWEFGPGGILKSFFRRFFDAHVLYSSFSRERLLRLGTPARKIFVATNVGDVRKFLRISDALPETPREAKAKLGLPDRFTVLYVGTLDANKRPELMLDLAKELDPAAYNFVLLGAGAMLEELRSRAAREGLANVHLPGRVGKDLPLYYRAGSAMLIPGRGGIVISEAMAFGVPVVVHEADGTEYDLIQDKVTGLHVAGDGLGYFREALEYLRADPERCVRMGAASREVVEQRFTTAEMTNQILRAARYAWSARNPSAPARIPEATLTGEGGRP